ncbi:MAG: hypothetical protein FWE73_04430 [Candidatus Bathyarchaeota archaeon]|nr:hypothetical protein [Candidatus Termitimicrobium sp.]
MRPILESLSQSTAKVLIKVAFTFEPLAPTILTIFINQRLHRYKESGIVNNYKTHTKRLGRYHYQIELQLDLTNIQAAHLAVNLLPTQLSIFRRWHYD